jgi:UDP-N-acetylglucosamine 2-epimerase
MIRIETDSGTIMAEAVIAGIPVDPAHPPSM